MSGFELPTNRAELFSLGLKLLDKDYFIGQFCPENGVDPTDLFAKAEVFGGLMSELRASGRFLFGMPVVSKPGPKVIIEEPDGNQREMIMFASNDYLGLSAHPEVHAAIREVVENYGVGAGSSRVNVGYSGIHRSLEAKLAKHWGQEAGLLYPTGYDAISSTIAALCGPNDRVIIDASSHSCIIDGARRSGATVRMFRHNDAKRLEAQLKRASDKGEGAILVVVEGAYSMDGDIAPLDAFVPLVKKYGARLMVDEAHAIGVLGARGHGAVEHFGLEDEVDLIGGTFSKSLGATGGFVVGDAAVLSYLNYLSTRIVFSAAFPPILAHGVSKAIDLMEADGGLRERLWENIRYFSDGFRKLGLDLPEVEVGAVPVRIHKDGVMVDFAAELYEAGIYAIPIVYPSVPHGRSMFRLAMQAGHTTEQLDYALSVFERLLKKYEIL